MASDTAPPTPFDPLPERTFINHALRHQEGNVWVEMILEAGEWRQVNPPVGQDQQGIAHGGWQGNALHQQLPQPVPLQLSAMGSGHYDPVYYAGPNVAPENDNMAVSNATANISAPEVNAANIVASNAIGARPVIDLTTEENDEVEIIDVNPGNGQNDLAAVEENAFDMEAMDLLQGDLLDAEVEIPLGVLVCRAFIEKNRSALRYLLNDQSRLEEVGRDLLEAMIRAGKFHPSRDVRVVKELMQALATVSKRSLEQECLDFLTWACESNNKRLAKILPRLSPDNNCMDLTSLEGTRQETVIISAFFIWSETRKRTFEFTTMFKLTQKQLVTCLGIADDPVDWTFLLQKLDLDVDLPYRRLIFEVACRSDKGNLLTFLVETFKCDFDVPICRHDFFGHLVKYVRGTRREDGFQVMGFLLDEKPLHGVSDFVNTVFLDVPLHDQLDMFYYLGQHVFHDAVVERLWRNIFEAESLIGCLKDHLEGLAAHRSKIRAEVILHDFKEFCLTEEYTLANDLLTAFPSHFTGENASIVIQDMIVLLSNRPSPNAHGSSNILFKSLILLLDNHPPNMEKMTSSLRLAIAKRDWTKCKILLPFVENDDLHFRCYQRYVSKTEVSSSTFMGEFAEVMPRTIVPKLYTWFCTSGHVGHAANLLLNFEGCISCEVASKGLEKLVFPPENSAQSYLHLFFPELLMQVRQLFPSPGARSRWERKMFCCAIDNHKWRHAKTLVESRPYVSSTEVIHALTQIIDTIRKRRRKSRNAIALFHKLKRLGWFSPEAVPQSEVTRIVKMALSSKPNEEQPWTAVALLLPNLECDVTREACEWILPVMRKSLRRFRTVPNDFVLVMESALRMVPSAAQNEFTDFLADFICSRAWTNQQGALKDGNVFKRFPFNVQQLEKIYRERTLSFLPTDQPLYAAPGTRLQKLWEDPVQYHVERDIEFNKPPYSSESEPSDESEPDLALRHGVFGRGSDSSSSGGIFRTLRRSRMLRRVHNRARTRSRSGSASHHSSGSDSDDTDISDGEDSSNQTDALCLIDSNEVDLLRMSVNALDCSCAFSIVDSYTNNPSATKLLYHMAFPDLDVGLFLYTHYPQFRQMVNGKDCRYSSEVIRISGKRFELFHVMAAFFSCIPQDTGTLVLRFLGPRFVAFCDVHGRVFNRSFLSEDQFTFSNVGLEVLLDDMSITSRAGDHAHLCKKRRI